jgi:hypothetical protein
VVLAGPLLEASAADVQLVVVAGTIRVAAPHLQLGARARRGSLATVGGVTRWIDRGGSKSGAAMNRSAIRADLPHDRAVPANRE